MVTGTHGFPSFLRSLALMDPLWEKYPQSPTHCSPENTQLSLNALVLQDYEQERERAAFFVEDDNDVEEEQQQQQVYYSRSSDTLVFESPASTSSAASPVPSRRQGQGQQQQQQQQRYDIDELEFVRHGHHRTPGSNSVWEEHLPEYQVIQDTYAQKKQEIFADLAKALEELQDLEHRFDNAKAKFHNQRLAAEYIELSKALDARKTRLKRETRQFQDLLQVSQGNRCRCCVLLLLDVKLLRVVGNRPTLPERKGALKRRRPDL